ncbi:MAG: hypothetical protein JO079_09800, partial [Frankiaceae bacterium]|nr:hypothetical protein [Frankiaceae bacterium]
MFASRRLAPSVVLAVLSVGLSTAPAAQAAGTATTVYAGGAGFGDGGPAIDARLTLGSPGGQVTTDPQGRVVFADPAANEIRRIDADGTIERIAGNGDHAGAGPGYNGEGAGFSGDGGPATSAALAAPTGVQVASDGTIYIADTGNARIRKVAPDGNITTIAGTGTPGTSATTQDASTAAVEPTRLRLASNGDLYFTENTAGVADVRKIGGDGKVSLVAGNVAATSSSYDQSACASSQSVAVGHCFERVNDVAVAGDGTVYLADAASLVYQVSGNTLTTLSGAYHNYTNSGDGSTATSATLNYPYALALDASGHVLVATIGEIRSITPGGNITQDRALAPSLSGTSMSLSGTDLLVLDSGTLISVATDGTVTTLAGAATNGTGDGLPAADAVFAHIVGVAATPDGGTLVGDGVGRVWNVDAQGIAHRVAGSLAGQSTFAGEGGAATDAVLPGVSAVATAPDGSFYVGTADGAVRHVDLVGMITTVAGTGTLGNGADASAPATTVAIGHPYAMTATSGGTLYILDSDNNRLRALAGGNLTTVAGTGSAIGRAAVGQPMSALNLHGVTGLASADDGSLRITVSPNGDTPWLYDVSSAGTVTKAQRTSNAVPAVDPSGDTLVGAGYGMVRMFPDGSEEQLTSYDNVEQWAHPPVMGV